MSMTVAKADGVTVFTLTTDPQSSCPPIFQILKSLCCTPECCSVSQQLKRVQNVSLSVLGTLHIMVGMLHIGLGVTISNDDAYYFWLAAMFILFGVMNILSEKFPSPCLVILNVILNLSGVGFAIAAIVLHSISIALQELWWMCENDYYYSSQYSTPSPKERMMEEKCLEAKAHALMFERGIIGVLIVLSVLELCVTISSAVLAIKALERGKKKENKSADDPEHYKPLLKDTSDPII